MVFKLRSVSEMLKFRDFGGVTTFSPMVRIYCFEDQSNRVHAHIIKGYLRRILLNGQFMTAVCRQRRNKIRTMRAKRPESMVTITVQPWGQLADKLIPIIGNGGFNSLYARACYLTQVHSPWLIQDESTPTTDLLLTRLSTCLAQKGITEARKGSSRLLITFLDLLEILIGESMTATIISSVWNDIARVSPRGIPHEIGHDSFAIGEVLTHCEGVFFGAIKQSACVRLASGGS